MLNPGISMFAAIFLAVAFLFAAGLGAVAGRDTTGRACAACLTAKMRLVKGFAVAGLAGAGLADCAAGFAATFFRFICLYGAWACGPCGTSTLTFIVMFRLFGLFMELSSLRIRMVL